MASAGIITDAAVEGLTDAFESASSTFEASNLFEGGLGVNTNDWREWSDGIALAIADAGTSISEFEGDVEAVMSDWLGGQDFGLAEALSKIPGMTAELQSSFVNEAEALKDAGIEAFDVSDSMISQWEASMLELNKAIQASGGMDAFREQYKDLFDSLENEMGDIELGKLFSEAMQTGADVSDIDFSTMVPSAKGAATTAGTEAGKAYKSAFEEAASGSGILGDVLWDTNVGDQATSYYEGLGRNVGEAYKKGFKEIGGQANEHSKGFGSSLGLMANSLLGVSTISDSIGMVASGVSSSISTISDGLNDWLDSFSAPRINQLVKVGENIDFSPFLEKIGIFTNTITSSSQGLSELNREQANSLLSLMRVESNAENQTKIMDKTTAEVVTELLNMLQELESSSEGFESLTQAEKDFSRELKRIDFKTLSESENFNSEDFIPDWDSYIGKLDWNGRVEPLNWHSYIRGLDWNNFIVPTTTESSKNTSLPLGTRGAVVNSISSTSRGANNVSQGGGEESLLFRAGAKINRIIIHIQNINNEADYEVVANKLTRKLKQALSEA